MSTEEDEVPCEGTSL